MSINNINKKVYSLKNFSNIYGINSKKVKGLCQKFGLNPSNKDLKLKKNHNASIVKSFKITEYDKNLKLQIRKLLSRTCYTNQSHIYLVTIFNSCKYLYFYTSSNLCTSCMVLYVKFYATLTNQILLYT